MANVVLSTHSVDRRERQAYWRHVLSDTFAPVELDGWDDVGEPAARLSGTQLGRLLITEIHATPQIHRRTARQIRQADNAFFQIAFLARGRGTLAQGRRTAALRPGDGVIYENTRPFTWDFPERWEASVLSLPSDSVRLAQPERNELSARRLDGSAGLSGVVARFLLDLSRHSTEIPAQQSERALAQLSDLVITLLSGTGPEHSDAARRATVLRVKDYIARRLRDPALGPEEIASAAGISTRYLHKLFETEHLTVSLYIRALRLECARDELLDPRHAMRSISAIAHNCGFGDVSGFNRCFKAAFGRSPGELRRTGGGG